jgi:hypothetical protein
VGNNTKPYYVILTGSKNNAGDYLIKYRAKRLFTVLREDRDIVDVDGWKPFDKETLELVNNSEGLILMGGPALQKNMYPKVYPLTENLNDIKCKIVLMGVGWKSLSGNWGDSQTYQLSEQTLKLLKRIERDGLISSVRDYHTLNALRHNGLSTVLMTGCPATYDFDYFGKAITKPVKFNSVSFSLGVSFLESKEMERQMKLTIKKLKDFFIESKRFNVVFHHSTKSEFLTTHNSKKSHLTGHQRFILWLETEGIDFVDISGSAENLINHYSTTDLHIGYRVHAHIFMNSISKPSLLIAEDGRGKALDKVFGGVVIDGFSRVKERFIDKVLRKLDITSGYEVDIKIPDEIVSILDYELANNLPQISRSRYLIDNNFIMMKKFINTLP